MADRLRIVEIPQLGDNGRFRPITLLDLEQIDLGPGVAVLVKEKDSFSITPPPGTPQLVQQASRYGGQRQVDDRRDNASIAATWRVYGSTPTAVIANVESFLQHADDLLQRPERFIEWRPEGVAYSTFYDPRAVGEAAVAYSAIQLAQGGSIGIQMSWAVAPLALGIPMDVDDAFSVDSEVDYRLDAGLAANVAVTGGQLTFTGALSTYYRLVHTAKGYRTNDKAVWAEIVKGVAGTAPNPYKVAVMVKVVDANNYLYVEHSDDGTLRRLKLQSVIAGAAPVTLQDVASFNTIAGDTKWLVGHMEGDRVLGGYEPGPSSPSRTATTGSGGGGQIDHTLAGVHLTAFGATVLGEGGIMVQPQHVNTRVNRLLIEHFFYKNAITGVKTLRGIPGTAPALVDAEVSPNHGLGAYHAMLAWNRPLSSQANPAFGPVSAELAGTPTGTGWSLVADANALSGDVRRLNMATMAGAKLEFLLGDDSLDPDPFTEECLVEFWLVMTVPTTAVALTIAARTNPLGSVGTVGEDRWTLDWGPYGRRIPTPPAAGRMAYRLGTIPIAVFEHAPGAQGTYFYVEFSAGTSTGNLDIDHLVCVPAKRRALGPTGKLTSQATYPKFIDTLQRKRIASDLRTLRLDDQSLGVGRKVLRHAGMEGSPLEMDATRQNAIAITHRVAHNVPDDPAPAFPDGEDFSASFAATYQFRVTPRYRLARS